jgi:hypothetical protein
MIAEVTLAILPALLRSAVAAFVGIDLHAHLALIVPRVADASRDL